MEALEQENAELRSHVEALDVALRASGERREAATQEAAELKQQLELMASSKGSAWYSEVVRLGQDNAELQERVGRLQRIVDLTESFFGAVAQGYPDSENEKRAELVVEAIAALSQPSEAELEEEA